MATKRDEEKNPMELAEAKRIVARGEPRMPNLSGYPEDAKDDYRDWVEQSERYREALSVVLK